ncbi:MAG: ABC transporter permease [Opitutales bacterium]|nr:ABC transporter permease [Opitutales bacterium]
MFRLALRMLYGDKAKHLMLISGIVFATILMTQGGALFCGIMSWTATTIHNVRAPIWVADPMVEQVGDNRPMRDTDATRVRSVEGVSWAVPLYQSTQQAKLENGKMQMVTLVGIDSATLVGAPPIMLEGSLEELRRPNSVIITAYGVEQFSKKLGRKVGIGDRFELNDREAIVVGVCKVQRGFMGGPYLYTTYDRAVLYAPMQRKMMSFVLAGLQDGHNAEETARRISAETGLAAFTEKEFFWSTIWWYIRNTPIPINIGMIVLIGFIVGAAVSGQAFYAFVLENTRNLGALKAMGLSTWRLSAMLVLQSVTVGMTGFGIGLGVVTILGRALIRSGRVPFVLLWQNCAIVGAAVIVICMISALMGIARIARLEPAIVFRS